MSSSYLHYNTIEKLGEGGMGIVYLAKDTKLNRNVALKFLPRHISLDERERRRFYQEAQSAALLNHRNIAQVYAIEEVENELFIAMEYVKGKELRTLIEEGTLTPEEKISIAAQIIEGLKAAHEKDVIHRDIKSRNIMVDQGGQVKIMDFGLARWQGSDHITKAGTTLGTTAYMAPEQFLGGEMDKRSDIWSCGVVLYELFSGRLPFEGLYEPAIIYSITEEEPPALSEIGEGIPKEVERGIARCLSKDPDQRYQDLEEAAIELKGRSSSKIDSFNNRNFLKKLVQPGSITKYIGGIVLTLLICAVFVFSFGSEWFGNGLPGKKYLAVLPVENIGGSSELQAICDGLGETFSYKLSEIEKYENAYWVAPASEMRKEQINSVSRAHKLFGVNLAILSSMQQMGDSTRLSIELVDAKNVRRLGSSRIVVPSGDLASLEQKGIKAVLAMLQIGLEGKPTINESPTDPEAYTYYLKGLANLQHYASEDSLNRAIHFFEESVGLDSTFALGYAGLGKSYWKKYDVTDKVSFVPKAEAALQKALALNSNLAPVQLLLGMLKAGTGAYEEALYHYHRALEIDPKYSAAYNGLAGVYDEQGDMERAEQIYLRAIELKPAYWEGYRNLASHYFNKGDYSSAITYFRNVVELTPENSTAYSNLGAAYHYQGNIQEARASYIHSLALEKNPVAASNLGSIYYWEGKYKEAAAMYKIATEANENRYAFWGNLAAAYDQGGEPEKARNSYLTALDKAFIQLRVNPNDSRILADIGGYYSDVADSSNAVKYIEKALKINPNSKVVREGAVTVYEQLGMREKALQWIDESMISTIEIEPDFELLIKDPRYIALKASFNQP